MENHILDIQLELPPSEEVFTSGTEITLDLENLIPSETLDEITLHDIDLNTEVVEVDEVEEGEDYEHDYAEDLLDNLDLDLDMEDLLE